MARTPRRTPKKDWKPAFIDELARRGNVVLAAVKAKVARSTAYAAKESDPEFAAAWVEAEAIAVELMEAEARRRAVEGTLRPVFQGGERVGAVREYSDTLLIFLLKARRPAVYRDNVRHEHSGPGGGPIPHEHGTLTDRIEQLAAAFAGAADRQGEGGVPGDRPGEPLGPGPRQGGDHPQAG